MPLRYLLLLLFCLISAGLPAQKKPFRFGAVGYYGFIFRHTPKIGSVTNTHPFGIEAYVNALTAGRKGWHRLYGYPEVGVALGMTEFNHNMLGQVVYGIAHLEKPFACSPGSGLRLKIGTGIAYSTQPYHPQKNFQNAALGSSINYAMRGEIFWTQRLSDFWQLRSGLMITHFSNAAFKVPNMGVNVIGWTLGFGYLPHPERALRLTPDSVSTNAMKPYSLHFSGAFTLKEVQLPGGRKHPGAVFSAYLSRRLNAKSAVTFGADLTLNSAEKLLISRDTTLAGDRKPDFKRAALTLGHELYISNRLSLLSQAGIYFYQPYRAEAPLYLRNGLKYYFHPDVYGGIMLKTHYGTADFLEWTVGFKID